MSANDRSTDEAIRGIVENWARAVRNKNIDRILANHSADVLMFDVPQPLQSKGIEDIRRLGICSFLGRTILWCLISPR